MVCYCSLAGTAACLRCPRMIDYQQAQKQIQDAAYAPIRTVVSIKSGWACPRCGKVYAPHVDHCDCKPVVVIREADLPKLA